MNFVLIILLSLLIGVGGAFGWTALFGKKDNPYIGGLILVFRFVVSAVIGFVALCIFD